MALRIYNTLHRTKRPLVLLRENHVGIYVCGMTVYDYCHVGHARVLVTFDFITRYLRYLNYQVTYVRNITDIDDKIIRRARENKEDYRALTKRFIQAMREDEQRLGVLPPDIEPCATLHIDQMVVMIQSLLDKGVAYIATNGDVYYDVTQFPRYGELAQQDLDNLQAGIRVEVEEAKRHPLDFVLWKLAKPEEPCWPSPWGEGRPGWHIECSAMSTHYLGNHFDIHGGGVDLQFPHHQNELAQAEAACDCKFVNYWMHVGHVQVNQEKMSKSLGNFFTIRDVLTQYSPEVIRYFIVSSHYRSPVNYAADNLNSAKAALTRFYTALRGLPNVEEQKDALAGYEARFIDRMNDDFNTPEALAVLFEIVREINRLSSEGAIEQAASMAAGLRRLGGVLGLLQQPPEAFLCTGIDDDKAKQIEAIIMARHKARMDKDWAAADRLRQQLDDEGIVLEDDGSGRTTWKKV